MTDQKRIGKPDSQNPHLLVEWKIKSKFVLTHIKIIDKQMKIFSTDESDNVIIYKEMTQCYRKFK